jgi:hypothetical protein
MNHEWKETNDMIRWPTDDMEVVRTYVNLVYTHTIASRDNGGELTGLSLTQELFFLGQLYVLCERLLDVSAKNAIIAAIIAVTGEPTNNGWVAPPTVMIKHVYEGTPESSPLRRLLVDMYLCLDTADLSDKTARLPHEFLCDFTVALRSAPGLPPFERPTDIMWYYEASWED